jgi:hypothetical protein
MCQNLTVLVQDDDWHYLGLCEHDTVHLVWRHLSLHLRADDFVALTDTVVAACLHAGPPPDSPTTTFRLRVGEVLLILEAEPFWQFANLMRRGAEKLTRRWAKRAPQAAMPEITQLHAAPVPPTPGLN